MGHNRDWKQYNKQLVNRGKINLWIKPEVLEQWKPIQAKKNGHPFRYSDELIKTMSVLRFKFKLSLRETEGFFRSFVEAIGSVVHTPCYTQVCRRMKILQLPTELLEKKNITDIALDTTGLKVYGEGEWRAEKYGGKKRWKKLHLALDPESGQLILAEITDEYVHDTIQPPAAPTLRVVMQLPFQGGYATHPRHTALTFKTFLAASFAKNSLKKLLRF